MNPITHTKEMFQELWDYLGFLYRFYRARPWFLLWVLYVFFGLTILGALVLVEMYDAGYAPFLFWLD